MRPVALWGIALSLTASLAVVNAQSSEFSGGWVQDGGAAVAPGEGASRRWGPAITIRDDGDTITIVHGPRARSSQHRLDDRESATELSGSGCGGQQLRTRGSRDGNAISISEALVFRSGCAHTSPMVSFDDAEAMSGLTMAPASLPPITPQGTARTQTTLIVEGDTLTVEVISAGAAGPQTRVTRYRRLK